MKKKIAILGSTGSIGKTTFNILNKNKKKFEIILLTTHKNINEILKQSKIFNVKNLIVTDKKKFLIIKKKLRNTRIKIFNDFNSLDKIFKKRIDYSMSSIMGLNGLIPTIKIIKYSKYIAIANKESIICAWNLINKELIKYKTNFIPVDSEHFSIWSLLNNVKNKNVDKIFITASGGPFRKYPLNKFKNIKLEQALRHPNWSMGKKISIDSATMMNKVFEIIEAKKIFNINYNQLEIIIHPHSYLHAIIKFNNGLTKLLIHDTNMTIPIFNSIYSLHEKKIQSNKLDFKILNNLNLDHVDKKRFPAVNILNQLKNRDSLFETVIVSANDCLVKLFMEKKIRFVDISLMLLKILSLKEFTKLKSITPKNINEITKLSNYVSLKINSMCV